jgi:putative YhdH/YhfP family quinone oxidoreductase
VVSQGAGPHRYFSGEAIVQESFAAYVVTKNDARVEGEVTTLRADQLPAGDVTIAVAYSSLNYKDALAATGQGGIVRTYPHVPGIDAAGTVVESQSAAVAVGDQVLVTGYDLGVGSFGGYAAYVRVPAAWVVKIPATLTTFEAMALGTAGFTAAMCLLAMERNGTRPEQGPVLVTGATGGVGSMAVDLLAQQGYTVAASTGKTDQHDYLRQLGASQILSREEVSLSGERLRPLLTGTWAGAVDTVGGATMSYLLRTVNYGGNIALCGLVGGHDFAGTVIPFLLRGINLLGIDSAMCPMAYRQTIWQRLATDLKPRHIGQIAQVITLRDLPEAITAILKGQVKGRLLVAPQA